jgi:hypothetical protein
MAQQTATQWLRKEVSKLGTRSRFYHDVMELIDEAEKKEKKNIMNGVKSQCIYSNAQEVSEQYYNEVFKKEI